jgi:hypothetical protein
VQPTVPYKILEVRTSSRQRKVDYAKSFASFEEKILETLSEKINNFNPCLKVAVI